MGKVLRYFNKQFFEKEILPHLGKNISATEIGKFCKCSSNSIYKCMQKYATKDQINQLIQIGKTNSKKYKSVFNEIYFTNNILPLILKGECNQGIATILNIHPGSVRRCVKKYGTQKIIKKLKQNGIAVIKDKSSKSSILARQTIQDKLVDKDKERINIIKENVLKGKTSIDISNLLNCHIGTIERTILRNNDNELYNHLKYNNKLKLREITLKNILKLNKEKRSKGEILLYEVTKKYFPNAISSHIVEREHKRAWILDVAILEHNLALEFDGTYWHQDTEKDLKRDKSLLNLGWKTIRFRYNYTPTFETLEQHFLTALKDYIK